MYEYSYFRHLIPIVSVLPGIGSIVQRVLLMPQNPFGGKISISLRKFIKDFPKQLRALKGGPNVLLVLWGEVGFGANIYIGGDIGLASEGGIYGKCNNLTILSVIVESPVDIRVAQHPMAGFRMKSTFDEPKFYKPGC